MKRSAGRERGQGGSLMTLQFMRTLLSLFEQSKAVVHRPVFFDKSASVLPPGCPSVLFGLYPNALFCSLPDLILLLTFFSTAGEAF